ncbi:unnamed protein product [Cylicocyclus nassatus]|uniref:Dilute domain-containing protein n=1 Tax=Cylicocyclus nassatus TaxID=53992 RepID=A0AA36M964_CYLNA|nr:unnamed protein product [Cylicocyclus nassatus]
MKLLLLTSIVVYSAETQYPACVSNDGANVKYNITKEDRDEALDKWAVDNDLLDVYRKYRTTVESAREERRKAILGTLDYLRGFFERIGELQANKSYTCTQESDGIRELCSTLNFLERRLVDTLMFAYRTGSSEKVKKALRLVPDGN